MREGSRFHSFVCPLRLIDHHRPLVMWTWIWCRSSSSSTFARVMYWGTVSAASSAKVSFNAIGFAPVGWKLLQTFSLVGFIKGVSSFPFTILVNLHLPAGLPSLLNICPHLEQNNTLAISAVLIGLLQQVDLIIPTGPFSGSTCSPTTA